jgi:ADP-heptose:LPS heptosyltransferase
LRITNNKILLIRFSSIGDIVLTTPVVRALKQQLPDSEIHFLTKESFAGLLTANPYISKIHTIRDKVAEVLPALRKENFSFIADLHHNLRSMQVKRGLGIPSRSFPKLNIEKWLLVNLNLNFLPEKHIVERYFSTVAHLGIKDDGAGLDYFIPEGESYDVSQLPAGFTDGFIVLTAGAKFNTKQMPAELLGALINNLNKPVIIVGGADDVQKGEEILSTSQGKAISLCGQISLHATASLVKQAYKVITHDTGVMHIAAAFQKDVISLWGNTVPEFGMYPFRPGKGSRKFEVTSLSCRPCSKLGFGACPQKHFNCMRMIDLDEVAKVVNGTI